MIHPRNWDMQEEFQWRPRAPVTATRDTSAAHPGTPESALYPVEAQIVIMHSLIALGLPAVFLGGTLLHASRLLPEILVGSIIVAFLYNLHCYQKAAYDRATLLKNIPGLRDTDMVPSPSLVHLVVLPCFTWPLTLGAIAVFAIWSSNQFVAILLPAVLCFYVFFLYGSHPVQFWQEFLFTQPEVEPLERQFGPRGHGTPDLRLLLAVLFVLLTAPFLLSAAYTYVLFAVLVAGALIVKVWRMDHPQPLLLVLYLLKRVHFLLHVYLNQGDALSGEEGRVWQTPSLKGVRFRVFMALYGVVFVVLITGLTYYCPWDFFAALFVPGFETGSFMTRPSRQDYAWLLEPFLVAFKAEPVAAYLFAYVAAIVGFSLFPLALMFALYFDQLVALEFLHQEIKAKRRQWLSYP